MTFNNWSVYVSRSANLLSNSFMLKSSYNFEYLFENGVINGNSEN